MSTVYLTKCIFEDLDWSRTSVAEQRQESILAVQKIIAREVRFNNRRYSTHHLKVASDEKFIAKDYTVGLAANEPSAKEAYESYAEDWRKNGKLAQAKLFEAAISKGDSANESLTKNLYHAAELLRSSGFNKDADWVYEKAANLHLCSCKPLQQFDSDALISIGRMNIPILRREDEPGIACFISQCESLIKDARSKNANPRCIAELEAIADANVNVVDIIEWSEISFQD